MATVTGAAGTSAYSGALRTWYEARIKLEQRSKSLIHRFVRDSNDPADANAKTVTYTRVYDAPSQVTALTELSTTLPHGWLDSDTVSISTAEYGWVMRTTHLLDLYNFWATGITQVVRQRVMNNYIDTADRQALNEYLTAEASYSEYVSYGPPGSTATTRATLGTTDIAVSDMVDEALVSLEGRDVSDRFSSPNGGGIYMLCHPFVLADILRSDEDYVTAALYQGASRRFNGFQEPLWNGVVPVTTTKMILQNAGLSTDGVQTTLGAAASGQSTAGGVSSITVASGVGLANGDIITISPAASGTEVLNTAAIEHAKIASGGGTTTLVLERPLNLDHASGAYVTKTWDIFPVIFVGADFEGGETVVRGFNERVSMYGANRTQSIDDPVGRFNAMAWYGVYGYDLISPWNMEIYMLRTGQTAKVRRQL